MKVDVMVVDDHTLFRKGMQMVLNSFPIIEHTSEAENGRQALDILKEKQPDIIFLDLDMPIMNGWEVAEKVLKRYPNVQIIILSGNNSLRVISELIEMGVHSYLLKHAQPNEVMKAIDSVMNNSFYYNDLVSKAINTKWKSERISKVPGSITGREAEVLELICKELSMQEIASKLDLSIQTALTHRKNLMKKVNTSSVIGLVKYALNNGLFTL